MSSRLRDVAPGAMTIGEVWSPPRDVAKYIGDELDLCFEFGLADAIVNAAKTGDTAKLREVHSEVLRLYPRGQYGRFLTNHDQPRVMTQLKDDEGKARAAAAMMLLGEGVPFVYYGEEIGMSGDKPDELIRTPMQWDSGANGGFTAGTPWQALNKDAPNRSVQRQTAAPGSLLSTYRELISLRVRHEALRRGGTVMLDTAFPAVQAFIRHTADEWVLVVINFGAAPVEGLVVSCASSPLRGGRSLDVVPGLHRARPRLWFDEQGGVRHGPLGVDLPAHGYAVFGLIDP
jgi:glycosidase